MFTAPCKFTCGANGEGAHLRKNHHCSRITDFPHRPIRPQRAHLQLKRTKDDDVDIFFRNLQSSMQLALNALIGFDITSLFLQQLFVGQID